MNEPRKYRFYDSIEGEWRYIEGENKDDALETFFGKERARMAKKVFKIERVYKKGGQRMSMEEAPCQHRPEGSGN